MRRRLRRRYGRSHHGRYALKSIAYRGKTLVVYYREHGGYESEIIGDGTLYLGDTQNAVIAKAKRVVDAMRGD